MERYREDGIKSIDHEKVFLESPIECVHDLSI